MNSIKVGDKVRLEASHLNGLQPYIRLKLGDVLIVKAVSTNDYGESFICAYTSPDNANGICSLISNFIKEE